MTSRISRRRFIQTTAGAASAAAFAHTDWLLSAAAPALPSPKGSGIDHIVVVMMENRSFDHMMGWVPGADGVLRACEAKGASGEVINVATGGRVSLNQLFQTIRDLVGARVEPIYADPRPGDVRDSQADIEKARRLLGYTPTVNFDEGLKRTVEWYRSAQATIA